MNTVRNEALKILAKKDISTKKIREKLLAKGFSLEEVDSEIENLKKKKLLNDEKIKERMKEVYLEKGKGYYYLK